MHFGCIILSIKYAHFGHQSVLQGSRERTICFSYQKHSLDASMHGIPLSKFESGVCCQNSLVKYHCCELQVTNIQGRE